VHGSDDASCILNSSANVFRPVVPVDPDRIDGRSRIVVRMEKFHDSGEVVRVAGRLTDEVGVFYLKSAHVLGHE
jgi:hypothetical protein